MKIDFLDKEIRRDADSEVTHQILFAVRYHLGRRSNHLLRRLLLRQVDNIFADINTDFYSNEKAL